ncbi:unnamed protein product [Hermetia illucens]|uniref:Uncharacterized protein n=1 Tax=Hermetia illucens TaxID=343691 RepID=A0A7R8Z4Z6_HERIL|nr:uncharacterized protein LOC119659635 isoform X2 [Hermetia illucens]CAD7093542.1 unnamed protein product [Hermetia illucens]
MNIYLIFFLVPLCVIHSTAARRAHGKRYDHNSETGNFENVQANDRGDEFHQLSDETSADQIHLQEDAASGGYQKSNPELGDHVTEDAATTADTTLEENDQKDVEASLPQSHTIVRKYGSLANVPAQQMGYGFKFSSVIPQDIRYTYDKEVPIPQPEGLSGNEEDASSQFPAQHLEGLAQEAEIQYDQAPPEVDGNDQVSEVSIHRTDSDDSHDEEGYSIGSGLRSIAQGSAHQAHSAVVSQNIAAQQAAFIAKSTLAQSAIQSAATAIAALAGKEVLFHSLERQTENARNALNHEISQLQLTKKTAASARHAAQKAAYHVSVLVAALNNAQQASERSEENAKAAAAELASQTTMVGEAKGRLDTITGKLRAAHIDFEATKKAASEASAAAEEAQRNALVLGEQASLVLHPRTVVVDPHYHIPAYAIH